MDNFQEATRLSKVKNSLNPDRTLLVMTYELGEVIHGYIYSKTMSTDNREVRAHLGHSRINLADLLTQCRSLCVQMNWDWDELLFDGAERYYERMQEVVDESSN